MFVAQGGLHMRPFDLFGAAHDVDQHHADIAVIGHRFVVAQIGVNPFIDEKRNLFISLVTDFGDEDSLPADMRNHLIAKFIADDLLIGSTLLIRENEGQNRDLWGELRK